MYVSKIEPYAQYSDLNIYVGGLISNSEENITIDVWTELTIEFLIKKDMTLKKHVSFVEQAIFWEESRYYVLLIDHFKLL